MAIFENNTAPYALTILISILTWVFSQAVQDARDVVLVSYSSSRDMSNGHAVMTFSLRNDSLKATLVDGSFTIVCPDNRPCLLRSRATGNDVAQMRLVPPWGIASRPTATTRGVSVSIDLPAGAQTAIVVSLGQTSVVPALYYTPRAGANVTLVEGDSLLGWVLRNYYAILFTILIVGVVLLTIWVLGSLFCKRSDGCEDDDAEPETIKVILAKEP